MFVSPHFHGLLSAGSEHGLRETGEPVVAEQLFLLLRRNGVTHSNHEGTVLTSFPNSFFIEGKQCGIDYAHH